MPAGASSSEGWTGMMMPMMVDAVVLVVVDLGLGLGLYWKGE